MRFSRKEKEEMLKLARSNVSEMDGDLFQSDREVKERIVVALQNVEVYD